MGHVVKLEAKISLRCNYLLQNSLRCIHYIWRINVKRLAVSNVHICVVLCIT
jgi:hypothetical protein